MARPKNPNNQYFNPTVEQAILDYNATESTSERNKLYTIIYPALSKVSEVYYNKVKPRYMEGDAISIQLDCICYLTDRLYHIKEGKGKAFSYMSVSARNYYIFNNDVAYKKLLKVLPMPEETDKFDMVDDGYIRTSEKELATTLLEEFTEYIKENANKMVKRAPQTEYIQLVIKLIEEIDTIEDFRPRILVQQLKKMSPNGKVSQPSVTRLLNTLELHYIQFKKHWLKYGTSMPYMDREEMTQEQIKYVVDNYVPHHPKYGYVGLSKALAIDVRVLMRYLKKLELAT
jgi:hypothetical protein